MANIVAYKRDKKIDSCSYGGQIISPKASCRMHRYGSLININPSAYKDKFL